MELRKLSVVLLALLLAGMAMVPMVNAANTQLNEEFVKKIEANYVSENTARIHATLALAEFAGLGALGEKETWIGANVLSDPSIIYDVKGTRLFYLFTIEKKGQKVGEIKIAATKILGNSIITIGPSNTSIQISKLEDYARTEAGKHAKLGSSIKTQLVAYAYPLIGMAAWYTDNTTGLQQKVIIDAYDYSVIPDRKPGFEGDRGIESYYETYPLNQQSTFIDSWNTYDRWVKETTTSNPSLKWQKNQVITENMLNLFSTTQAGSKTVTEYKVLSPFTLTGAETTEWCTVGTAKMISDWYGISRTQTAIASRMGIPTSSPYRGATINEELNYYQGSQSSGGLGKPNSLDYYTINWADSKTEINNNRPFKVGNNGHARAMVGYIRSSSNGYTYFYFKDPSPLNQGSEYWEWFNELNPNFYNNHIKIR